ncbi:Prophage bactoprenol-linked glucose translocase-like protein [Kosakonia sp. BK9b]
MLKLFTKYTSVGVLNTLLHWAVFALCLYAFNTNQAVANLCGFIVAVSFSFYANARFTFKSSTTLHRYVLYVGFMGALSLLVGYLADRLRLPPAVTLVSFSAISLICGFVYSKVVVFREDQ